MEKHIDDLFNERVDSIINIPRFRKKAGFETIKKSLDAMGYNDDIPIIHVAGTNGKGSVCAMLLSILRQKEIKVGMFTSPHLVDIRERMTVNGKLMDKKTFLTYGKRMDDIRGKEGEEGHLELTFFEWMLSLGMMHFKEEKVDVILLETGIGGKSDTTNVLNNKILTIITNIGYDHTQILGDSIEAIARRKAGIARANVPMVVLNNKVDATRAIEEVCYDIGTEIIKVLPFNGKILKRNGQTIDFSFGKQYYNYEEICEKSLKDYRLVNAMIAITASHHLSDLFGIEPEDIINGIANYQWPGRLDYLSSDIVVDGAHNPQGMEALAEYLNVNESNRKIELLFTCMPGKDVPTMTDHILAIQSLEKIYVPVTFFSGEEVAEDIRKQFKVKTNKEVVVIKDLEQFIEERKHRVNNRTLLACVGSLYLVGEVIKCMGTYNSDGNWL